MINESDVMRGWGPQLERVDKEAGGKELVFREYLSLKEAEKQTAGAGRRQAEGSW